MSNAQVDALVRQLIGAECVLRVQGWSDEYADEWELAHSELNKFFSSLEIRKMMWEAGKI